MPSPGYVCSSRSGQNAVPCQPDFDEVRVTQRINNDWPRHTERVDSGTATMVKPSAWREKTGVVKIAVRKSAR